jgi:hypothetical protein
MSPQIEEAAKDVYVVKKAVPPQECSWLISMVGNDWDQGIEPVDKKPLWQTYEYGPNKAPAFLYGFASELSSDLLIPLISRIYDFDEAKLKASRFWPFIRKYSMQGRRGFRLHPDPTYFSAVVLLNKKSEFTGGSFMTRRNLFTKKTLVDLDQGDCVIFRGHRKHGVAPITSGVRHSLNMFYWNPKEEN